METRVGGIGIDAGCHSTEGIGLFIFFDAARREKEMKVVTSFPFPIHVWAPEALPDSELVPQQNSTLS